MYLAILRKKNLLGKNPFAAEIKVQLIACNGFIFEEYHQNTSCQFS